MASQVNDVRAPGARTEVTENARKVFIPPMPLTDAEFRQWELIIERRAAVEWETGIDLHIACVLAKLLARYERESEEFASEDSVITGARGTETLNPRIGYLASLQSHILRYEKRLRFDVEAGDGNDRKSARRAERKAEARDQIADEDPLIQKLASRPGFHDDGLIPRPGPQAVQ